MPWDRCILVRKSNFGQVDTLHLAHPSCLQFFGFGTQAQTLGQQRRETMPPDPNHARLTPIMFLSQ